MKDYILGMHAEVFNQSVRQTIFLDGMSANDNEFDLGKDIFQGQLIVIDYISLEGEREQEMVDQVPTKDGEPTLAKNFLDRV